MPVTRPVASRLTPVTVTSKATSTPPPYASFARRASSKVRRRGAVTPWLGFASTAARCPWYTISLRGKCRTLDVIEHAEALEQVNTRTHQRMGGQGVLARHRAGRPARRANHCAPAAARPRRTGRRRRQRHSVQMSVPSQRPAGSVEAAGGFRVGGPPPALCFAQQLAMVMSDDHRSSSFLEARVLGVVTSTLTGAPLLRTS